MRGREGGRLSVHSSLFTARIEVGDEIGVKDVGGVLPRVVLRAEAEPADQVLQPPVREKCYYYAINSKTLETDGKLLRTLTDNINKNIGKDVRAGFQVYSTSYEQNYGYLVANTELTNN